MTSYPQPPWRMHGDLWLTTFRLAHDADVQHPAGVYGVGFVDYREPSPLAYGELFAARRIGKAVTVIDMWVDSSDSVAGGRELWGFPKELCEFTHEAKPRGGITRVIWSASAGGTRFAEATFTQLALGGLRVPMKGLAKQPGLDDHPEPCTIVMAGSAKTLPARARWHFADDGLLGWLREARQLGSVATRDFKLAFE